MTAILDDIRLEVTISQLECHSVERRPDAITSLNMPDFSKSIFPWENNKNAENSQSPNGDKSDKKMLFDMDTNLFLGPCPKPSFVEILSVVLV